MHEVYMLTNRVNDKVYIGQTSKTVKNRWYYHKLHAKLGSPLYFHKAIRKHGADSFDLRVLAEAATRKEADNLERLWIILLQSSKSKFGYNSTSGGDGCHAPSEETRKKLSKAHSGKNNPRYHHNLNTEEIVSAYLSGDGSRKIADRLGVDAGCILSRIKEAGVSLKPSGSQRGKKHPLFKDVPVAEMAKIYESGVSTAKIARDFGVTPNCVCVKLRNFGIKLTGCHKSPDKTVIRDLYSKGRTLKEVGQVVGCTEAAVQYWLIKLGISRRSSGPRKK